MMTTWWSHSCACSRDIICTRGYRRDVFSELIDYLLVTLGPLLPLLLFLQLPAGSWPLEAILTTVNQLSDPSSTSHSPMRLLPDGWSRRDPLRDDVVSMTSDFPYPHSPASLLGLRGCGGRRLPSIPPSCARGHGIVGKDCDSGKGIGLLHVQSCEYRNPHDCWSEKEVMGVASRSGRATVVRTRRASFQGGHDGWLCLRGAALPHRGRFELVACFPDEALSRGRCTHTLCGWR